MARVRMGVTATIPDLDEMEARIGPVLALAMDASVDPLVDAARQDWPIDTRRSIEAWAAESSEIEPDGASIAIINDATNDQGEPYAGFVHPAGDSTLSYITSAENISANMESFINAVTGAVLESMGVNA